MRSSPKFWKDCSGEVGHPCYHAVVAGSKAQNLFAAVAAAGVETDVYKEIRTFSLLGTTCSKTSAGYTCSMRYHKADGSGLSPVVEIQDMAGKSGAIYEALADAGAPADCSADSCVIKAVSIGCRNTPPECRLSRISAMEVAW
ncbi:MAG: hypothetical protein A2X28_09400 [Elusimicrobia bacterium GWA2_56_46]|jgi:hypothetical protein|nr:MAG: hypothetical protein A2X28_09400 [Elusimicrobia bacterium GWA2_56_46]OGR55568.1 MAG: hypothetical protein A2X39_08570 [Elusimicrobia bacterium GWC2_56_31]HBB67452.1 hypothetical protein [Elusimicrobiota bacterium]HBW22026.1 hypothetical protein [Elusimicrobiota bacterium]